MDEIAYREAYNTCVSEIESVQDIALRKALLHMLQLIDGLDARITELADAWEVNDE